MPAGNFVQVDVFTDTPFCGNPLAVILDGQGLTGEATVVCLEHEPGDELGRPSRISIEVVQDGLTISSVRVGGRLVKVIDGTVYVSQQLQVEEGGEPWRMEEISSGSCVATPNH